MRIGTFMLYIVNMKLKPASWITSWGQCQLPPYPLIFKTWCLHYPRCKLATSHLRQVISHWKYTKYCIFFFLQLQSYSRRPLKTKKKKKGQIGGVTLQLLTFLTYYSCVTFQLGSQHHQREPPLLPGDADGHQWQRLQGHQKRSPHHVVHHGGWTDISKQNGVRWFYHYPTPHIFFCAFTLTGDPEPHASFPQHAGLSRLDGLRRGLQPAEEEGAGLGLRFYLSAQRRRPQSHGGKHSALPESRPGNQEEHDGQRAAPLRRHQRPLRR